MIWARRTLAILFAVLFVPFLLLTLVVLRVNGTLLEPDFYKEEFSKADLFTFLYDDVLPAAVDDALAGDTELPSGLNLTGDVVSLRVQSVVPPEWIQEQVEGAVDRLGPYLTGQTDEFTITVPLSERADAALVAFQDTIRGADLDVLLYEDVIPDALEGAFGQTMELPLGVTMTQAEAIAAVKRVAPPDWFSAQVESAVDDLGPYLTGRSEGFTVVVPLADRASAALAVVNEQLGGADLHGFLNDEIIGPAVEQDLSAGVSLPLGITLTQADIRNALDQVFTEEWVRGQTAQLVDNVGPYITGASPGFEVTIPISDRVDVAEDILGQLLDRKLVELVDATPTCTPVQLLQLIAGGLDDGRPSCLPPGFTVDLFKSQFDLDVTGEMRQVIAGRLANDLTYADADLRQALSSGDSEAMETLDKVRETIRDGITFTEIDLRRVLTEQADEGIVETLDTVRETIRDGISFTQVDLQDALAGDGDEATLEDIDRARGLLNTARGLWFLLPVALAVALAVIGVLGGRGLGGKAAWAGAALAFAAAVTLGLATVARGVVEGRLDVLRVDQLGDGGLVETMLIDKGFAVANSVLGDLLGWITTVSLGLVAVGIVVAAAGMGMSKLTSRSQPAEETAAE